MIVARDREHRDKVAAGVVSEHQVMTGHERPMPHAGRNSGSSDWETCSGFLPSQRMVQISMSGVGSESNRAKAICRPSGDQVGLKFHWFGSVVDVR